MKKSVITNIIITGEKNAISDIQKTIRKKYKRLSVKVLPTIQFNRCKLTPDLEAILSNMQSFNYLFLSSSRAVYFLVDLLTEAKISVKDLPPAVVVGPRTKEACEKAGIKVVSQPETYTAAAMVNEFQELKGAHILFPRSTIAPEDTLALINSAGAKATGLPLYETVHRTNTLSEAEHDALLHAEKVLFFSPSSVRSFVKLLENSTLTTAIPNITAFCIGPRTEQTAKENGFETVTAKDHTVKGLIETLGTYT